MSAKSCAVGMRVEVACRAGSRSSSCTPSGRTGSEIGTTERTRSGCETASSRATPAPKPVDAQVIEQRDHIACQRGRGVPPVDVGGAAVALQLDADHLVPADQLRDQPGGGVPTRAGAQQQCAADHDRQGVAGDILIAAGRPRAQGTAAVPVFTAIDPQGSQVTELAQRSAMSKQAVGDHIRYLTGHGYLTVTSDPDDRRAKTVALTERGWEALDLGERVIADYDTWLATAVGVDQVAALRETLHRITATPRRK